MPTIHSEWSWIRWGIMVCLMGSPVWSAELDQQQEVNIKIRLYEQKARVKKPTPAPKLHVKPVSKPKEPKKPVIDHDDRRAWLLAKKCGTATCFKVYLKNYPKGRYVGMVQTRLKSTSESQTPTSGASIKSPALFDLSKVLASLSSGKIKGELTLLAGRYRDNGDGTVTDMQTNLQWNQLAVDTLCFRAGLGKWNLYWWSC